VTLKVQRGNKAVEFSLGFRRREIPCCSWSVFFWMHLRPALNDGSGNRVLGGALIVSHNLGREPYRSA
jgi:hypothetical protein